MEGGGGYVVHVDESRDSSVGIETRYSPDGRVIESRWMARFSHPSEPALVSPSHLYNGYGGNATGAWR
jgi:hypothetical protein